MPSARLKYALALRVKITEGLVYHESGDQRRARQCGDALEKILEQDSARPDTPTCLELATLLFAVGSKAAPAVRPPLLRKSSG